MVEPRDRPALRATVIEVRDAAGAPVADAAVSVIEASVPWPEMAYLTDAAGRLALSLPPGSVTLAVVRGNLRAVVKAQITPATEAQGEMPLAVTLK